MRYSNAFGINSSKILLGTAYFGDGISEEDAFLIMDKFRERGGNHIDTARLYAKGLSEEIVGKWVKERGARDMHISTKGGYYEPDNGEEPRISEKEVRADIEKSLTALRCDEIEFFWLHRDDENIPVGAVIEMMNTFLREGKIRRFGASNWRSERIDEANRYARIKGLQGFEASQIRFNCAYCLGERGGLVGMDEKEFDYYKNSSLPVVAYSSQAKGFFSKMANGGETSLSEKAKRRYLCDENLKRLEVIKKIADELNCCVAAVVCAAVNSFEKPDSFSVIGGSRLSQIEESLSGADIKLEKEQLRKIFADFKI